MKKIFIISVLIIFSVSVNYAQDRRNGDRKMNPIEKIEEWEKIKLIDVLNLDEKNSVRFFSRRKDHMNKIKAILDQRDQLADKMEAEFKDGSKVSSSVYNEQIKSFMASEVKLQKERENYFRSLSDILTPEQIAKLTVFEVRFRKEIRQRLMHGKEN
jgi:hypothetical protein